MNAQCDPTAATKGMLGCSPTAPSAAGTDYLYLWQPSLFPNSQHKITVDNLFAGRGGGGGIPEAPSDGSAYGRGDTVWKPVLQIIGGTLTGSLLLSHDPVAPLEACTKQYAESLMALSGVTKVDRSGVITLGGTAQQIMAANPARKGWSIQNKSTADMWFNDLGNVADPVANNSTYMPAGAYYESESGGASIAALSLYCAVTGAQFVAKEW